MDYTKTAASVRVLEARQRTMGLIIVLLSLALLVACFTVLKMSGTEKTVIVPAGLNKTFWITQDRASNEYLEQMGGFIGWLVLDVTPQSIDWKKQALLTYMAPDAAADMKTRIELEADRLKKLNASTYFVIQALAPDERNQSVGLAGQLRTQINGVNTSAVDKRYIVEFEQSGGKVHVKNFKEISNVP